MSDRIWIGDLKKGQVLAVLWHTRMREEGEKEGSWPTKAPLPLRDYEIERVLASGPFIGVVGTVVMNIDLSGDWLDATEYNANNGALSAETAIAALRETGETNLDRDEFTRKVLEARLRL